MEPFELPKMTKVLIVEDEPAQMELTKKALVQHGAFQLNFGQNGQEAFKRLNEEGPDLVLLDLGLPDCDGLDVCRRLKEEERFRWIPVIMLTGRSTVVDKITGVEVRAHDYLTTPCDPADVDASIRAVLHR